MAQELRPWVPGFANSDASQLITRTPHSLEFPLTNDLNGLGPSVPLNIDDVLGTPAMANGVFGAIFDLL